MQQARAMSEESPTRAGDTHENLRDTVAERGGTVLQGQYPRACRDVTGGSARQALETSARASACRNACAGEARRQGGRIRARRLARSPRRLVLAPGAKGARGVPRRVPRYIRARAADRASRPRGDLAVLLGPVHTMPASANGCHGAPIEALDEAKTGCLCEESNEEWRARAPVPFGLLPKGPCASLRSLGGLPARLRLRASRMALSAVQRTCGLSVNRP